MRRIVERVNILVRKISLNLIQLLRLSFTDQVDVLQQTTYNFIYDKFLVRGLPVIVSDTAVNFNKSESLAQFIENISVKMSGMIQEEACNLETNLMMPSYARLGETLGILLKMIKGGEELPSWFISFRNCKFKAVELKFGLKNAMNSN